MTIVRASVTENAPISEIAWLKMEKFITPPVKKREKEMPLQIPVHWISIASPIEFA